MSDALMLSINRWADWWWHYVTAQGLQATLFAAVLVALVVWRRRWPAPLRYTLLMVALLRFIVPAFVPVPVPAVEPTGVAAVQPAPARPRQLSPRDETPPVAQPRSAEPRSAKLRSAQAVVVEPSSAEQLEAALAPVQPMLAAPQVAVRPSLLAFALVTQALGAVALVGWIAIQSLRLARQSRAAQVCRDPALTAEFASLCAELGLRRGVELRITDLELPPQSFGVLKPTVLLPRSAVENLSAADLRLVLLHELGHHVRWDPAAKWLQLLVLALWWFHPLVWLLIRKLDQVREQACDELVLVRGRVGAADYCRMLVSLAEQALSRPSRLGPAQAMHPLGERMHRLLDRQLRPAGGLSRLGLAATIAFATILLARGVAQEPARPADQAAKPTIEQAKVKQPNVEQPAVPADPNALVGTVVTPEGQPAANVEISVPVYGKPSHTTRTDEAGRFTVQADRSDLRGALVLARSPGGLLGQTQLSYELPKTGPLEPVTLQLQPARLLDVVVTKAGAPAAGARVVVHSKYHTVATGDTNAEGKVQLAVPRDAPLQFVLASDPGAVDYLCFREPKQPVNDPYQLAQDHSGTINLSLAPTRTVVIHVQDQESRPLAGVQVTPWLLQMPNKGDSANLGSLWTQTTNAEGDANFALIPQKLEHGITFWTRLPGLIATQRTHLEANDTTGRLTATLLPLTTISGRVVNADDSPAVGVAVSGDGAGYDLDGFHEQTQTDAEGRFKFEVNPDCYCMFAAVDKDKAAATVARIVRLGQPIDDLVLRLAPAARVFGQVTSEGRPVAAEYITLYQEPTPDYYELPEDERLPNPTDSRTGIAPRLTQSVQTDAEGRYEFFTGPGKYYLTANHLMKAPRFTIVDAGALEQNLALSLPPQGTLKGRVLLANQADRGIAGIRVVGQPESLEGGRVRATTDSNGRFEERRANGPSLFTVLNEDRSLGALERVLSEQAEVTLALAPTATATGVLIDTESNTPAANKQLIAYIRMGPENGPFTRAAEVSTMTDAAGEFSLPGLIVSARYHLCVVVEVDAQGQPFSWQTVTQAEAPAAGSFPLGELLLPVRHRPPTVEDDIQRAYSHPDAEARLTQLLSDAEFAYSQVLVVAADPAGQAARRYFEICHRDPQGSNEDRPKNLHEYLVMAIDPAQGSEVLARHKLPAPTTRDEATFAILNPAGAIVAQANSADLSASGQLDAKLLSDFLANRRAPLPNANQLLREALEQAKQSDKRVLVQVGGPGCGWCIVLGRYLQEHKELIGKDYIHLKLDSRMPEAEALIATLRKNKQGGIPWMVILDADGRELITSDAAAGNIGYPSEPEGQAHWKQMLSSTRKRLTDEDLEALVAPLEKPK